MGTSTKTITSTSSTRTTSTTSSVTTTTRPGGCFEMCCEPEPVQGVHLPVMENVCPEWWQGARTSRVWGANDSTFEDRVKSARSQKPDDECAGCDLASGSTDDTRADGPSEGIFFQK